MKVVVRKLVILIGVLALIFSTISADGSSIVQAASSPRSGSAAPAKPDIDCTTSPFGPVLTIGGEKEIFVGYRGGSAPNSGWLAYSRLDVITSTGALAHQDTWLGGSISSTLTNVSQVTGAATDLNADGKSEFVQSYYDTVTPYNLVAHRNGLTPSFWKPSGGVTRQQIRAVAGDVTGDANHDGEIVLTSRYDTSEPTATNGTLDVRIINGNLDGGFTTDPLFNPLAFWRSGQITRTFGTLINSTVGDLDGDGIGEVVVAFREDAQAAVQLIVLQYKQGYSVNEGNSGIAATNLKEVATWRLDAIGDPNNLKLATGNLEGDFERELVLAYDHDDTSNPGFSDQINVRTYHVQITPTVSIAEKSYYLWNSEATQQLALTTADTDQDALDEIIVAARTFEAPGGLVVRTLDAEQSTILVHNTMRDNNHFRSSFFNLEMDAGDLDRDGQADIVAAFRDQGSQLQVIRIADQITATAGMTITSAWRDGTQGRTNVSNISLSLGDWDDDSLKAVYAPATGGTILCKQVEEPQLTSAIFVPPYWKNIQDNQDKYGTVGKARSTSVTTETAVTNKSGHSFSAYFGVGVGGSFGPAQASAAVRATGGYEFSAGKRRSNATITGKIIQEGWNNTGEGFVVYDTTAYNCYSYQLRISGADLDGHSRFCEVTGLTQKASELDAWDSQNGLNQLEKYQWTPVARDWANLALFRRVTETVQSSTSAGGEAARAVDGNLDGNYSHNSVSHTADELAPWWQTDLGSAQAISKIRLWNRTDCCTARLADYYVFVSNTDFRSISNDPNVLIADSRVRTYTQTLNSGRVTTILALDHALNPITGRYVRVQLRNTGTARPLSLAEVQVFGANHVEPDRYPTSARDVNPDDGYFEVKIFNRTTQSYHWVPVRGKLLWNGVNENVLANSTIGPGNVTAEWSLQQNSQNQSAQADSFERSASVGVEFEVEAGFLATIQAGGSYEYSQGVTEESSRSTSWGTGFEVGGGVAGFPLMVNGQNVRWPGQCQYGFQPYYYWVDDASSYGYDQSYLVLDYIVPGDRNNSFDLDRMKDLSSCRNGTYKTGANTSPDANDDGALTAPNTKITINVLTNDADPDGDALNLQSVGAPQHGLTVIKGDSIEYTPNNGYTGADVFTYSITDGLATSTATVRVIVGGQKVYLPAIRK